MAGQGIVIIGGGIGGLTAAIALGRHGIPVRVYEAAPELRPVGSGIVVAVNGMHVFRRLGLEQAVEAAGHRLAEGRSARRDLSTITTADFRALERRFDGCGIISLHRARLQSVLAAALPAGVLHLGKRCVGVEDTGAGVVVRFADGTEASGEAAVGADGLHSLVRAQLFPGVEPRYAGQTSWRGVTTFDMSSEQQLCNMEIWGGDATRFGIVAIGHGEVYWFAVADAPAGGRDEPGGAGAALQRRFAHYHELVLRLIAATPEASIVRTDISDLPHLPAWHKGRIALLGDAAHATTPNLGQGGNQAIEDALCLALRLEQHRADPEAAFAAYFAARHARARFIVDASRRFGEVAHWRNPVLTRLRNAVLGLVPAALALKQMERIVRPVL